jgi:hypothetical protein
MICDESPQKIFPKYFETFGLCSYSTAEYAQINLFQAQEKR